MIWCDNVKKLPSDRGGCKKEESGFGCVRCHAMNIVLCSRKSNLYTRERSDWSSFLSFQRTCIFFMGLGRISVRIDCRSQSICIMASFSDRRKCACEFPSRKVNISCKYLWSSPNARCRWKLSACTCCKKFRMTSEVLGWSSCVRQRCSTSR